MDRPKVYSGSVGNEFVAIKTKPTKPKIENQIETIPVSLPAFAGVAEIQASARFVPDIEISSTFLKRLIYLCLVLLVAASLSLSNTPAALYSAISNKLTQQTSGSSPYSSLPASAIPINATDKNSKFNQIMQQSIALKLGDKKISPSRDEVAKWVKESNSPSGKVLMAIKPNILAYLNNLNVQHTKKPIDQVVATRQDGSTQVVIDGANGIEFINLPEISSKIADQLMSAAGIDLEVPSSVAKFSTVPAPAGFKWIDVSLNTKHMEAYEQVTVAKSFLVSAGAPATPTPQGKFKIFEKLPLQNMRGFNANGTRYSQPNVRYVSYFSNDVAIHGNYWRPLSWFGNKNTSHGCVGIADSNGDSKWIYDWAPVGTPVVVHN